MSMRIFSAGLLLVMAGCGPAAPGNETLVGLAQGATPDEAAKAGLIGCALAGAEVPERSCSVDRTVTAQGLVLTLRNPDGGFHRVLVTGDGRGVIAADGAEKAVVRIVGSAEIEVAIGGDRYRLPATIAAQSATAAAGSFEGGGAK